MGAPAAATEGSTSKNSAKRPSAKTLSVLISHIHAPTPSAAASGGLQAGVGAGPKRALLPRLPQGPAQFELGHRLARDPDQEVGLPLRQPVGTGRLVDDADGAQGLAPRRAQDRAGVEADEGRAGDQRVVGEALVQERVRHHHQLGNVQGVLAEGLVARRLADAQAHLGLEPLPLCVDQADGGHGGVADRRGQLGQVVELGLARAVQHVVVRKRRQAAALER